MSNMHIVCSPVAISFLNMIASEISINLIEWNVAYASNTIANHNYVCEIDQFAKSVRMHGAKCNNVSIS